MRLLRWEKRRGGLGGRFPRPAGGEIECQNIPKPRPKINSTLMPQDGALNVPQRTRPAGEKD